MEFPQQHTLSVVQDLKLFSFWPEDLEAIWSYFLILQMRKMRPRSVKSISSLLSQLIMDSPELECKLIPYHNSSNPSQGCDTYVEM